MSRRRWWTLGSVLALLVVGLVAGPLIYAAVVDDAPPAATVRAQPEGAELSAVTDGTWTIAPGSAAGYRVDEVLNGADNTVAGTTDQVTGSVVVAENRLVGAEVTVDIASVATDNGRRDAYFRGNVMHVEEHPTAVFRVTGPTDLPELTGAPVTVLVTGGLTVTGTTRPVQVELAVVRTPQGVDVSGSIPVTFADYGIRAPSLGFVRVEDAGSVEFLLHLTQ
jgi:polyisoprenoid-binding protein YceI